MKLNIKNDYKFIMEFCCGEKEYVLGPGEEIAIEVQDEDYMYFDVVRENNYICCDEANSA